MRILSLFVLAVGTLTIGCSHAEKKSEPVKASETKAATAPATKADAAKSSAKVECAKKGDDRTLEVRDKGHGCELAYTKGGKEGVVASAAHGKNYCEKALEKLEEKLKGAGYDCK